MPLMCQKETLLAFFKIVVKERHDLYAMLTKPVLFDFFFFKQGGGFILCWFLWGDYDLFHGTDPVLEVEW